MRIQPRFRIVVPGNLFILHVCCSLHVDIKERNNSNMFFLILCMVVSVHSACVEPFVDWCSGQYCESDTFIACPQNYYCPRGSTSPTACPSGRRSYAYSCSCSACTVMTGYYTITPTSCTDAVPCPAGFYCSVANSKVECRRGYYCGEGSTRETDCPLHHYCPVGSGGPWRCPDRTYTTATNQYSIDQCIPLPGYKGRYNSMYDCVSGYYCPGDTYQYICSNAQYSPVRASACLNCAPGSVSTAGSSQCNVCESGFYSNAEKTICMPCNPPCPVNVFKEVECTNITNRKCCDRYNNFKKMRNRFVYKGLCIQEMRFVLALIFLLVLLEHSFGHRLVLTFATPEEMNSIENLPFKVVKRYGRRIVIDMQRDLNASDFLMLRSNFSSISNIEIDSRVVGISNTNESAVGAAWPTRESIYVPPSETREYGFWYLGPPPLPWNLEMIGGSQIWNVNKGQSSVVIAVLDTGIRETSKVSFSNLVNGYDFISDLELSVDGDMRDSDATDVEQIVPDSWCAGPDAHGTKVSSILGARHESFMFGIAPNCKLLSVRTLGLCSSGLTSDVADSIVWASGGEIIGVQTNQNQANIIVLSLAGDGDCPSYLQSAINLALEKNIVVVAATGNDGRDTYLNTHPANCVGVVTVGSVDSQNIESYFSNKGGRYLYPGEDVAVMGDNSELMFGSGTSYAVSHYAGLLALNLSKGTQCNPCPLGSLLQACPNSQSICCLR